MRVRKTTKSELEVPKTLVIPRSAWAMGNYSIFDSQMLDTDSGALCCLGHLSHAMGVGRDYLQNNGSPEDVVKSFCYPDGTNDDGWNRDRGVEFPFYDIPGLTNMKGEDTLFSRTAMSINDNETLSTTEREGKLIKLFAGEGIKLTFVGVYPLEVREQEKQEDLDLLNDRQE